MWLHDWSPVGARARRRRRAGAQAGGLTHLYVQTGSSRKGWIGTPVLSQLLPATAGTGLGVVAWDFPSSSTPRPTPGRLARAATFRRPGAPRVAAVAPDVETGAEGTHLSAAAVDTLLPDPARRAARRTSPMIATVPWPSEHRTASYPYARTGGTGGRRSRRWRTGTTARPAR